MKPDDYYIVYKGEAVQVSLSYPDGRVEMESMLLDVAYLPDDNGYPHPTGLGIFDPGWEKFSVTHLATGRAVVPVADFAREEGNSPFFERRNQAEFFLQGLLTLGIDFVAMGNAAAKELLAPHREKIAQFWAQALTLDANGKLPPAPIQPVISGAKSKSKRKKAS